MTGEISLTGVVLPIGGVKEKVLGARRAGIKEVILPADNEVNVKEDLQADVLEGIKIYYVRTLDEVLEHRSRKRAASDADAFRTAAPARIGPRRRELHRFTESKFIRTRKDGAISPPAPSLLFFRTLILRSTDGSRIRIVPSLSSGRVSSLRCPSGKIRKILSTPASAAAGSRSRIVSAIRSGNLAAAFIESYAAQYDRQEFMVHEERNRELQSHSRTRNSAGGCVARRYRWRKIRRGKAEAQRSTKRLAIQRDLRGISWRHWAWRRSWTAGDVVEFRGEFDLYRAIAAAGAAKRRA